VWIVHVAEMTFFADDLRAAQLLEHAPPLVGVAPVRITERVDELEIGDVCLDPLPVIGLLEDRLLRGVRRGRVAGDEYGWRDRSVRVLEEGEQRGRIVDVVVRWDLGTNVSMGSTLRSG
jgi:hypothetical protein